MNSPKKSRNTNNYKIDDFKVFYSNANENHKTTYECHSNANHKTRFGIHISFQRNSDGINGILIYYHLMCAVLVLVSSINYVIDPKVVPGRAGLLITVHLVLTTFFSDAQVPILKNFIYCFH